MQGEQGNIAPLFQLSLEFSPSAPNEERIPQGAGGQARSGPRVMLHVTSFGPYLFAAEITETAEVQKDTLSAFSAASAVRFT